MDGKHTKGPWRIDHHEPADFDAFVARIIRDDRINPDTIAFVANVVNEDEAWANAALIAEAGTVATETGLTPRQLHSTLVTANAFLEDANKERDTLLSQRDALREALEALLNVTEGFGLPDQLIDAGHRDEYRAAWAAARAALSTNATDGGVGK
jgi:hypothetical protein